jgi:hypothetical protein
VFPTVDTAAPWWEGQRVPLSVLPASSSWTRDTWQAHPQGGRGAAAPLHQRAQGLLILICDALCLEPGLHQVRVVLCPQALLCLSAGIFLWGLCPQLRPFPELQFRERGQRLGSGPWSLLSREVNWFPETLRLVSFSITMGSGSFPAGTGRH